MAKSLEQQLSDVLVLYSQEVTEQVKKDAKTTAYHAKGKIQKNAPSRSGRYKKNWAVKKAYEDANEVRYVIYNKKPTYRLTHLLESGHAKKGGGRVRAYPHIRPAELWAQKEFVNLVKKAVQK